LNIKTKRNNIDSRTKREGNVKEFAKNPAGRREKVSTSVENKDNCRNSFDSSKKEI